jgi:hypothetical protein
MEHVDAHPSFVLSISPAQLVYSEVLSVTSVMRKNSRWASTQPGLVRGSQLATSMGLRNNSHGPENSGRPSHDMKEASLMAGFEQLKRTVQECEGEPIPCHGTVAVRLTKEPRRLIDTPAGLIGTFP